MPNQPLVLTRYKITHGNHPRSTSLARVFQCLAVPRQPPEVFGNTGNASSRNSDQISLIESRHLARFRRRLSRGAWLFPRCYLRFSRFGCRFSRRWQFRLGLFRSAMVAMVQRLNARGFFFQTQLCVLTFLVLGFKVFWNSFRCHGQSVAELSPSKLSNFGHSATIHRPPRRGGTSGRQLRYHWSPVRVGLAPYRDFSRTGAQVRNRPFQSRFAVAHPTWSRTRRQR
jgi:hypothetical protein